VRAKGLIVVAIPLIALVAITSTSMALQHSERQERAAASAAFNVISAANQVLVDAINAETGVRGYAATGNPAFLSPYRMSLARVGADRSSFRAAALAYGDVSRQRAADRAAGQALSELGQLRAAIGGGASLGSLRARLANDKQTVDSLRGQIAGLARRPSAQLAIGKHAISTLESEIDWIDIAGLALGLLAGLIGVGLFTSGISRRVVAAAANATRLGEGRSLDPVASSGDDIGRLTDSLVRAGDLLDSRAAELTGARDEAVKATQAKNAFLSSTSHELRTPLNSILGFTQLLELSSLDDEDRDSVQRILAAGRHLLALINELIDIARIESGDLSLSLESVAVVPLIEEVTRLMTPLAAERSVRIITNGASPVLAAHADRQRFSQVLVNLISNAVKYNRVGGTITISCHQEADEQVSVIVSDTGHGMSADDMQRMFVPFERLGAEQSSVEGTGIGLPLARTLTEAMGGQLAASSVVGEGSTLTVKLPRAADLTTAPPGPAEPSSPAKPQARPAGTFRIFYIEDNPANVEVVSRFVRNRMSAQLWSFPTGREGIDCAVRERPDVIFLDLHLQDIHGEQVLNELKADSATAGIPVVVLSADATPGVIRRLRAGGALAYLTKPLDLAELGKLLDSFAAPASDRQDAASIADRQS
jgi:signal transduction histidine kinase/CheY-like chemotaxis protein